MELNNIVYTSSFRSIFFPYFLCSIDSLFSTISFPNSGNLSSWPPGFFAANLSLKYRLELKGKMVCHTNLTDSSWNTCYLTLESALLWTAKGNQTYAATPFEESFEESLEECNNGCRVSSCCGNEQLKYKTWGEFSPESFVSTSTLTRFGYSSCGHNISYTKSKSDRGAVLK